MSVTLNDFMVIFFLGGGMICMGASTFLYNAVIAEVNSKLSSKEQFSHFFPAGGNHKAVFERHREFYPRDRKMFWMKALVALGLISWLMGAWLGGFFTDGAVR